MTNYARRIIATAVAAVALVLGVAGPANATNYAHVQGTNYAAKVNGV